MVVTANQSASGARITGAQNKKRRNKKFVKNILICQILEISKNVQKIKRHLYI